MPVDFSHYKLPHKKNLKVCATEKLEVGYPHSSYSCEFRNEANQVKPYHYSLVILRVYPKIWPNLAGGKAEKNQNSY